MKTPTNNISSDIIVPAGIVAKAEAARKPRPHIIAARAARQARRANH